MPKDGLTVQLAHFSPLIEIDNPDALHPVGVSHLEEYMRMMFGEDVPQSPEVQRLSRNLLASMTTMSIDEAIYDIDAPLERRFGLMLGGIEPVIDDAKRAGRFVDRAAGFDGESYKKPLGFLDQDTMYLLGIFDLSTFIMSTILMIEHPRHKQPNLTKQARSLMPGDSPHSSDVQNFQALSVDLAETFGILRPTVARNFRKLRGQAEKLIANAERQFMQATATVNAAHKQE